MRPEEKIFQLLSSCCNSYVFVGNMETDRYLWNENAVSEFGFKSVNTEGSAIWDRLIHPQDYSYFMSVLQTAMEGDRERVQVECRIKNRNGDYVWMRFSASLLRQEGENALLAGIICSLHVENTIDWLTDLRNNYEFRNCLSSLSRPVDTCGVMIVGIDNLKHINEYYSYAFGDELLNSFARDIQRLLPKGAIPYRLEEEKFGMICPGAGEEQMRQLYDKLQTCASVPRNVRNVTVTCGISAGMCFYPQDGEGELLYRNARLALSEARAGGRGRCNVYRKELSERAVFHTRLLDGLQESVRRGFEGFSLNYQPLVDGRTGSVIGCEALLRWKNKDFPQGIAPVDFIPVLEDTGMILEVGDWVLDEALEQCARWKRVQPGFTININVTAAQFETPGFATRVMDKIGLKQLPPGVVTLELTESGRITNTEAIEKVFDFLRSQGVKIAFDDFGMGYSSFGILRTLSADEIKIDRSFLERISYNVTDQRLTSHMIRMCHALNIIVCVEGVAQSEIEHIIRQLDPDLLQGFLYDRPIPAEEFGEKYISADRADSALYQAKERGKNSCYLAP